MGEAITEAPKFDWDTFDDDREVELPPVFIDAVDCQTSILKQNSLFITDLAVVEDPVRTFNVVTGTGNPVGVWTFGNLIKNITNEAVSGVSARTLLKNWLKGWTDGRTINGQFVPPRTGVFRYLIEPWLVKANRWSDTHYVGPMHPTADVWEQDWDNTSEDSLLKYAPFKLMAIVNRLDLKGNIGYTHSVNNAGETRFIYTLIAPVTIYGDQDIVANPGESPRGLSGASDFIDWQGMNVILEFGNPQTTRCDLRDYAQAWLNLSGHPLGSPQFNQALESITHTVINANAAPNKPNGSALDQIRTNERLFAPSASAQTFDNIELWKKSDWELSQFELDNTSHLLLPAPVSNTPNNIANRAYVLPLAGPLLPAPDLDQAAALIDWVFKNQVKVHAGMHSIPSSYTYNGWTFTQAAVADINAEQVHFWDVSWDESTTYYQTISPNDPNSHLVQKDVRQQLSLNTCQGCHSGETKTVFTQIRPVGYGESQDYWSATPAYDYRTLDTRFGYGNIWSSNVNGTLENNHQLPQSLNSEYFQRLSAFLTGRRYSGPGNWQDDLHDNAPNADDAHDNTDINNDKFMLFQVYDPTDNHDGTTDKSLPKPDRTEGYNDLEMRKQRLCQFLNSPCSFDEPTEEMNLPIQIIKVTAIPPLPKRGH